MNITSANKVVIFDPHWNPSYDLQAQDRAYRIGQVRDVDVFRLISAGTIEEIVYARQIYKQQQANIGYNASTERRYFKGVQQDKGRKGEIFGLSNLLGFKADQVVLRDIVNKTNIAEAKVGVSLTDIDMGQVDGEDGNPAHVKEDGTSATGDEEDGGMSQLAEILTSEDREDLISAQEKKKAANKPKTDAIAAILSSAGVEYTHENSEVIGSSKVEAQLSRRAEMAATGGGGREDTGDGDDPRNDDVLFADSQANGVEELGDPRALRFMYNPPTETMKRQFCSMAKEFGFRSATDFALVVENWNPEQRTNCLDTFYKQREAKLLDLELESLRRSMMGEKAVGALLSNAGENSKVRINDMKDRSDIKSSPVTKQEGTSSTGESSVSQEIEAWTEEKKAAIAVSDGDDDDDEL